MKGVLIDTHIYSYALKGDTAVVSVLQRVNEIGICAVSIGELLSGFKGGKKEKDNKNWLAEFLDSPRVHLYVIDENTAEFYTEILANLKRKGEPIPTNDIWIAAVAFQQGLTLFTRDLHFNKIPGLILFSEN